MKILEKITNLCRRVRWKIARFLYQIEIHSYPKSPYFPAHTEVLVVFFGKFAYEAETIRIGMDETGHVDVQKIFDDYPYMHRLQVHYPDDWDNRLDHFRQSMEKRQGKHKPIKEDKYR